MTPEERRDAILALADEQATDENHSFDEDAAISEGEDNGCYVQCWVWITFEGTPLDKEREG